MPTLTVKLYSVLFKFLLNRKLQSLIESPDPNPYGVVSRPDETIAAANPIFSGDGVATKDIHIDPLTSLSLRIFLPDSAVVSPKSIPNLRVRVPSSKGLKKVVNSAVVYGGYSPDKNGRNCRKLPVILQFHGGGWVSGGNDTAANDAFCRRVAKLCDAVVVAVGYRLAPESRYPAAFDDGVKALSWLGKQANLADCNRSLGKGRVGGGGGGAVGGDGRRRQIVDGFGASVAEPWLATHGDPSRRGNLNKSIILDSSVKSMSSFQASSSTAAGGVDSVPLDNVAQSKMKSHHQFHHCQQVQLVMISLSRYLTKKTLVKFWNLGIVDIKILIVVSSLVHLLVKRLLELDLHFKCPLSLYSMKFTPSGSQKSLVKYQELMAKAMPFIIFTNVRRTTQSLSLLNTTAYFLIQFKT